MTQIQLTVTSLRFNFKWVLICHLKWELGPKYIQRTRCESGWLFNYIYIFILGLWFIFTFGGFKDSDWLGIWTKACQFVFIYSKFKIHLSMRTFRTSFRAHALSPFLSWQDSIIPGLRLVICVSRWVLIGEYRESDDCYDLWEWVLR